ncbi:MAG: molybdenum cofactor guanylyltransferase MobA [Alphaproteobacteria bacterium]
MTVVGVLLAGGLARRMGGGDKALKILAGRPLIEHVMQRVRGQVDHLILNANGDPARFAHLGLPVVADEVEGFAGPLAGVLSAMTWAASRGADRVASFPTDAPFLPDDLVAKLLATGAPVACARSAGQAHPVVAVWSVALADDLRRALVEEGLRKIDLWTARHGVAHVDWPAEPVDPFFNANRPDDLAEAARLLA